MKHKHYDLIMAWANGAEIQYKDYSGKWTDVSTPSWGMGDVYRIKPKRPLVRYARAACTVYSLDNFVQTNANERDTRTYWSMVRTREDNIKATFDPDTFELLTVEKI